jgi:hypothetical protein
VPSDGAEAVAKQRKAEKGDQWGWRLGGLALLLFFAFGMIAGVSAPGRELIGRIERRSFNAVLMVDRLFALLTGGVASRVIDTEGPPVVLVERWNGFFALSEPGELTGPVSPGAAGDLPVLSGPAVATATVEQLMTYAEILIRAEATLSMMVSEMRVDSDGVATLFLNRDHIELAIDVDSAQIDLQRAVAVLDRWRGHKNLIAAIDMTVPAQAVVRLRAIPPAPRAALQRTAALISPRDGRR